MLHSSHREQTVVIIDVHLRVLVHKSMNGLVVVDRVARADEVVIPSHVVNHLSLVRRPSKFRYIRADSLRGGISIYII